MMDFHCGCPGGPAEAELFDFGPGRDQAAPCPRLGRQGIQIISVQWGGMPDFERPEEDVTYSMTAQLKKKTTKTS